MAPSPESEIDGLTDRLMRTTLEGALVKLFDENLRFMTNEELVRLIFLREKHLAVRVRAEMKEQGYRLGTYEQSWADWLRLTISLIKKAWG
jgi:hypothetical protein